MEPKKGLSYFAEMIDGWLEKIETYGKLAIITAGGLLLFFIISYIIFLFWVYYQLTGVDNGILMTLFAVIIVIVLVFLPLYLFFEYGAHVFKFFFKKDDDVDVVTDPADASTRVNPLLKFFSFFGVIGIELKRLMVFIGENRLLKGSLILVILLFLFFTTTPYFAGKWGGIRLNSDKYGLKTILDTNGLWPGKYEFYNPFKGDGKMTESEIAEYNLRVAKENRKRSIWNRLLGIDDGSTNNNQESTSPEKNVADNPKKSPPSDDPAYFQYEEPQSDYKQMTDAELNAWKDDGVDYTNRYSDVVDDNYQYANGE